MKQFRNVGGVVLITCAVLGTPPAQAFDGQVVAEQRLEEAQVAPQQRYQGPSLLSVDKDLLAKALLDYGMWREEHDRKTFPADMPDIGEPYDPVTGNAIRSK